MTKNKDWYDELITEYKVLGHEMNWQQKSGVEIQIKDMADSHVKNTLNMLKRKMTNESRSGWIYIFDDVLMNRRSLKLNKIMNNIENEK